MIIEEWMDDADPLETRMFYELMQQYRHCQVEAGTIEAFEAVKAFIRETRRADNGDGGKT